MVQLSPLTPNNGWKEPVPTMLSTVTVLVALPLLLCLVVARHRLLSKQDLPLPPKAVYSHGSATSANQPWKLYDILSKSLGSVFLLPRTLQVPFPIYIFQSFLRQYPSIVLNDATAANELFQKRSELFSDRPPWPMRDLLGREENVGFMHYGSKLTKARKLVHSEFNASQIPKWDSILEDGISTLMSDLALNNQSTDSNPRDVLRRNLEQILFRITYGAEPAPEFLSLVKTVHQQTGAAMQPGRWVVNSLPSLAHIPPWFPFAYFQRWARDAKALFIRSVEEPFNKVKQEITLKTAKTSFVYNRLTATSNDSETKLVMSTAGSVFSAGVDTTVSLLETIFIVLARNPGFQERIYAKLVDHGFDLQHLDLKAAAKLPIFDLVVKEGLRFNPPVPLLVHSPSNDTTYGGWRIPRGSWVFVNVWSILHDASVFKDPQEFNPERFLDPHLTDPMLFAFGLGRRKCPGLFLGQRMVCMVIARTVSLYKIMPVDNPSKPIEFTTGLISYPAKLDCVFVPRSP